MRIEIDNKEYELPDNHFDKFDRKLNHLSDETIEHEFKTFGWEVSDMITLERIKNIADDIIADDDWVNVSRSQAKHSGIKAGLYALIHHLEELGYE